jgi:FtsP/CotA-like multicopper oxidase with cupredoxin domain
MAFDTLRKQMQDSLSQRQSRRHILKMMGLGLTLPAAASVLAACGSEETASGASATGAMPADHAMAAASPAASAAATDWQAMDKMHEEGIKAFPAKTAGEGNVALQHRMDGDVKVFELTCKVIQWEVTPGTLVEAWSYNGQVPGPEIRVTEGDKVRVIVKNELPESTAVHWHGVMVPSKMDGVPFLTQPPITPGSTFTYEFQVKNSGSHMYHAHHNSTKQVGKGLLGAFIIEPKNTSKDPAYDIEHTMILNDQLGGFTLNGKGFPATAPLTAKLGQKLRIRYMNEGVMIHPMHLHGLPQLVFAKDGWNLPQPYMCDTINVAPGERYDVIVECTEAGLWAFHCHILSHAESEHGMFGMVTALIVE